MSDSDPAEVTEADLAELERLEKAATAAPWEVRQDYYIGRPSRVHSLAEVKCGDVPAADTEQHKANAGVIAAARNALPKLLAEVRRERAARRDGAEAVWRPMSEPSPLHVEVLVQAEHTYGKPGYAIAYRDTGGTLIACEAGALSKARGWRYIREPEPDRATESERDRLVRERDAALDALKFYADEKSWLFSDRSVAPPTMPVLYDSGKRAREVLAQSGGGGGKKKRPTFLEALAAAHAAGGHAWDKVEDPDGYIRWMRGDDDDAARAAAAQVERLFKGESADRPGEKGEGL